MSRVLRFAITAIVTGGVLGGAVSAWERGAGATHTISQKGRQFAPDELTIQTGDTLEFVNDDGTAHHVMNQVGSQVLFSSPLMRPGESFAYTFNDAGVFHVTCAIHPLMHLAVTVVEDGEDDQAR